MSNGDFPIEYHGITSSNYPFPSIIERTFKMGDDVIIKGILRLYLSINIISSDTTNYFSGIDYNNINYTNGISLCICKITFNIEYIDDKNIETINIFSDYIYSCLHLPIENTFSHNNFSPKICHANLKLLDNSSIYLYLAVSPY